MKHILALLLALTLAFGLAVPGFARSDSDTCTNGGEHVWVSYTIPCCVTNADIFGDPATGAISCGCFRQCTVCGEVKVEGSTPNAADHRQDPFTDISASGFHDYIIAANILGLVTGFNDGSFRPKTNVTRAQFITMLWRLDGEQTAEKTELTFADQADIAQPFRAAVAWGVENGIIQGYGDNTFAPRKDISRAQMATFLYRYFCMLAEDEPVPAELLEPIGYADEAAISGPYKAAVNLISNIGVMNGTGSNMFSPNGTADRGMAATVLVRSILLLAEEA